MKRLDRGRLRMHPLSDRVNRLDIKELAVSTENPVPPLQEREREQVARLASKIKEARRKDRPVILTFGAHLIKNGIGPLVAQMIDEGWITHLATNGAGSIHDWEFAFLGHTAEDVRANTAEGRFGAWEETGSYINLAVALGGLDGLGYGASVGRLIADEGLRVPAVPEVIAQIRDSGPDERQAAAADLLWLMREGDIGEGWIAVEHPFKRFSLQHAAHARRVPFTVHTGIGYDITHTHPLACGGAIGRASMWDFLSYAASVSRLSGGVHVTVGSAIMAPMIFEKSLSMANNLALQEEGHPLSDYYLAVVDIQDGGGWDWRTGEPPMDNPAYYLRFCKSFYRMGGTLDYLCMDNVCFMLNLYEELRSGH